VTDIFFGYILSSDRSVLMFLRAIIISEKNTIETLRGIISFVYSSLTFCLFFYSFPPSSPLKVVLQVS
jgi:hypothetical protein